MTFVNQSVKFWHESNETLASRVLFTFNEILYRYSSAWRWILNSVYGLLKYLMHMRRRNLHPETFRSQSQITCRLNDYQNTLVFNRFISQVNLSLSLFLFVSLRTFFFRLLQIIDRLDIEWTFDTWVWIDILIYLHFDMINIGTICPCISFESPIVIIQLIINNRCLDDYWSWLQYWLSLLLFSLLYKLHFDKLTKDWSIVRID